MDPSQVMKGILETAVLASLSGSDSYGYELVRRLRSQGFVEIADASVYGTLRRLYRAGLLSSQIVESEAGPPRKYYSLNDEGRAELERSEKTWHEIASSMNRILERGAET